MNKLWFNIVNCFKVICRILLAVIKNGNECEICGKIIYKSIICETCLENKFIRKISSIKINNLITQKIKLENPFVHKLEKLELQNIDKVGVLFPYDLWNKELLYRWKIAEVRSLSSIFANLIAQFLLNNDIKILVPVPPRKGKIKEKGWDQIEELCQFLEFKFNFTILRILERKSSIQQKKLNRTQRFKSSEQSYFLKSKKEIMRIVKNNSLPESVCLLDDVMTTGATINRCGKILKEGGIKQVIAVTLFMV